MRFLLLLWPILSFATLRMGIISDHTYFGEREVGWRIKRAAESLGWEVFLDEQRGEQIQKMGDLDWTICLVPTPFSKPKGGNYMAVFHPFGLLDKEKKLNPFYESFDGYLLTIKSDYFNAVFRSESKPFFSIPFYPTLQPIPYEKVPLNHLIIAYPAWGHRQTNERYKTLYRLLSESGFAKFYGPKDSEGIIQQGHIGEIPFDGISVIETLQKHGITLVLHSWHHRTQGLPSGRIFEAAAASTVIICDENPFVKEHFGDSIYYIDVTLAPEEIFNQIAHHMESIRNDPNTALAKAKRAHEIFTDRFQMTDQLLEIQFMHSQVIHQSESQEPNELKPFVLFTEPKTGTHLLIPILESLTKKTVYWAKKFQENSALSENDPSDSSFIPFSAQKAPWTKEVMDKVWYINKTKGSFLHLHAPYSRSMENYLIEKNAFNFFLKRDPRDQIVSLLNHYRHISLNDPSLASVDSDDERLLLMIRKELRKNTLNFMGWLQSPVACVLDFAKLMGAHGGAATDLDALEEMRKIALALKLNLSEEALMERYRASFGHGWSFFRGKVGSWKEYFKEEHKIAAKEEIGDLLIELGYEEDLNW